jgi:hypothetical protein
VAQSLLILFFFFKATRTIFPAHSPKLLVFSTPLFYTEPNEIKVIGAVNLIKRDLLSFPDPVAVITVDGEQIATSATVRRILSPAWNESFDLYVSISLSFPLVCEQMFCSTVKPSSMIVIQIFDHKKFKRRDQGTASVSAPKING